MSTDLNDLIVRIRKMGQLPELVAKKAVPYVEAEAKATARAGTTPTGTPWPKTRDGKAPLQNAAEAVFVRSVGPVIQIGLKGTTTGSAKVQAIQNTRRQIIPKQGDDIPPKIVQAIDRAAKETFQSLAGGGRG